MNAEKSAESSGPYAEEENFSPWRSYTRSHHVLRSVLLLALCSFFLAWWGGDSVLFPNLAGNKPVEASGAAFVPVLTAALVLISAIDDMADFSQASAYPRWRLLALHLGLVSVVAVVEMCGALLLFGNAEDAPLGLRNFLGFLGLAAFSCAWLGFRLAWVLPMVQAVPAFLIGSSAADGGGPVDWWQWPRAAVESGASWTIAVGLVLVGLPCAILTSSRRR